MPRRLLARAPVLAAALTIAACSDAPGIAEAPVIFGADDRVEVHAVTDETLRELVIRAVPALVRESRLLVDPDTGAVTLTGPTLMERRGLCDDQAFLDQTVAASCSATLIDDDLVLTAGHCLGSLECADQRYVFGWYYEAPGVLRALDEASVFACAEVVALEHTATNDYAIVRLDRAAAGPPVEVRRDPVVVGETVSLAGFPLGIPMKVVEGGAITQLRTETTFYARLDAHPGNSGSGVFDAAYRVVGELTAGPISAFDDGGTCTVLRVIGEDTTRTETINSVVPAIAALCASGFESERLCPVVCGDGTCDPGEDCPDDCTPDAGPADAGADPFDASPVLQDAASLVDAASAPHAPSGCGCRAGAARGAPSWALALAALAIVAARRRASRA
jgi:MYXO-CTERM domain-containing protein